MEKTRGPGRPRTGRIKKPLQIVLDPKILKRLDEKAEKSNLNRSTAIQEAVKKWLNSRKTKKTFSNIYQELFPDVIESITDKSLNEILRKMCNDTVLNNEALSTINAALASIKINIEKDFSISFNKGNKGMQTLLSLIVYNQRYPIKNYFAVCKICNNLFLKIRKKHFFDSPECKFEGLKAKWKKARSLAEKDKIERAMKILVGRGLQNHAKKPLDQVSALFQKFTSVIAVNNEIPLRQIGNSIELLIKMLNEHGEKPIKDWEKLVNIVVPIANSIVKYFQRFVAKNEEVFLENWKREEALNTIEKDLFSKCENSTRERINFFLQAIITPDFFAFVKTLVVILKKIELNNFEPSQALPHLRKAINYLSNDSLNYFLNKFPSRSWFIKYSYNFLKIKLLSIYGLYQISSPNGLNDGLATFQDVVKKYPLCLDARYGLIYGYFEKKEFEFSIKHFKQVVRITSRLTLKDNFLKTWPSKEYFDKTLPNSPERFFKELMILPKFFSRGAINLFVGCSFFNLNRFQEAINLLKSDDIDYEDLESTRRFFLGLAFLRLGNLNEALNEQKILMNIDPDKAHSLGIGIKKSLKILIKEKALSPGGVKYIDGKTFKFKSLSYKILSWGTDKGGSPFFEIAPENAELQRIVLEKMRGINGSTQVEVNPEAGYIRFPNDEE